MKYFLKGRFSVFFRLLPYVVPHVGLSMITVEYIL